MKSVSQRLLRGGVIAVIGKSSIAIGVVLVNVLVARLLSPAETGLFLLALSIVTVAAVIATKAHVKFKMHGIKDVFGESGSPEDLMKKHKLDKESLKVIILDFQKECLK